MIDEEASEFLIQLKHYSEKHNHNKTLNFEMYRQIFEQFFPEYILSETSDYSKLHDFLNIMEEKKKIRFPKAEDKWFHFHGVEFPEEIILISPKSSTFTKWKTHPWHPILAKLATVERMSKIVFEEMLILEEFLQKNPNPNYSISEKERSLQIFGDEKRLGILNRTIGKNSKIDLIKISHSYSTFEPLTGYHFPKANESKILFVENRDAFFNLSLISSFLDHPPYAHIYYGQGLNFLSIIETLPYMHSRDEKIEYFGDIDPTGFYIPQKAKEKLKMDYPEYSFQYATKLYLKLIGLHKRAGLNYKDKDKRKLRKIELSFLGNYGEGYVKELLDKKERIPQELLHMGELINFYKIKSIPKKFLSDHEEVILFLMKNFT
ncbi:Wadjet anti-phage system protein JetD domain-containing protein [Candidatus Lokiarchaeum ossiferum]|uniref:Wadjet anti-phage system protein JetD domain-containing protein n=1 Tax=Candidatus Lokiarchaeum ossiferum TaxID=2951803 RepID=UPI00352E7F6C